MKHVLDDEELAELIQNTPAPKICKEYIELRIEETIFSSMKDITRLDDTTTICTIFLDNGFTVRGESACVNPENYVKEVGEKIAYDNAFSKLWAYFGFLLAEHQYREANYNG